MNRRIQENDNEFESCWIELINTNTCNTLIGTYYRHHSDHDSIFKSKLKETLKTIKKEKKTVILCGDFNYNLLEYVTDKSVSDFLNTMLEFNFQPCITEPSKITNTNKPSLVDNIFINTMDNPSSGNILEHISNDHLPNFIILDHEKKDPTIKIKIRDNKNFNNDGFLCDLQNPTIVQQIEYAVNTEQAFEIYHKVYTDTLNKYAPIKYLSKKEIKIKQKPWLTPGIQTSIKKKRALFKQIKSMKLNNQNTEIIYNKYKTYRNMINTLKRKSKKLYYSKYFTDNTNNSKNTWKGINKLLNRNKSKQETIFLQDNDGLINDQRKVANKFNEYFINVAGKLSAKIQNKNTKFQDYLKNPNESSLFLKETTPDEVNLIINSLSANKSRDI